MQPVIDRITTAVLGISTFLLFLAALCELIVAGNVHHRLNVAFAESYNWVYQNIGDESEIPYIPFDIQSTGHFIYNASRDEIAAGALGLVTAIIVAVYIPLSLLGRDKRHSSSMTCLAAITLLLIVIYVVAAMIAICEIMSNSLMSEPNATIPDFRQVTSQSEGNVMIWALWGWDDTTSWQRYTCEAAQLVGGWFVSTCAYQRGALYNLIPLMALMILTTLLFLLKIGIDMTNRKKAAKAVKTSQSEAEMKA